MLEIYCDFCKEEIDNPGAILIAPPDSDGRCLKSHICVECYDEGLGVVVRKEDGQILSNV